MVLFHNNVDDLSRRLPVLLHRAKIRGTPLGGSHCEGDLGRNLQVLRVEDRFKNIKEDHHADGIDDHHRNDHDLYDLNGRIKRSGEQQDQNNMDHLGNERDSKQKCIRVLAVFLLLPADKGTDDPVDDCGEHTGHRGDPLREDQIPVSRRNRCRDKAGDRTAQKSGGQAPITRAFGSAPVT